MRNENLLPNRFRGALNSAHSFFWSLVAKLAFSGLTDMHCKPFGLWPSPSSMAHGEMHSTVELPTGGFLNGVTGRARSTEFSYSMASVEFVRSVLKNPTALLSACPCSQLAAYRYCTVLYPHVGEIVQRLRLIIIHPVLFHQNNAHLLLLLFLLITLL